MKHWMNETKLPKRFTVKTKQTIDGTIYSPGDYALKKKRLSGGIYLNMDKGEMLGVDAANIAKLSEESIDEAKPVRMDTPDGEAYKDFKKYAHQKRSMFKKEMLKHVRKSDGQADSGKMFMTLSALWYKWAYHNAKEFKQIKDKLKFGRALMVMMLKDNIIFDNKAWKKNNKITNIKEEINKSDIILPADKTIVLQAGTDEHKRGLVVTWLSDGGYSVAYWYDTPDNIVAAELKGDGESFGDITNVWLGYHPKIDN